MGAWIRWSCPWIQFVPGGAVCVRFYVRLLAPSIAAQLFGCFVLLDVGPYRLEGGGTRSGFYVAAEVDEGCSEVSEVSARRRVTPLHPHPRLAYRENVMPNRIGSTSEFEMLCNLALR